MQEILDGSIVHVATRGTELENFCRKGQRLCLVAYHNDEVAYLYPLTTSRTSDGVRVDRMQSKRCWLVVSRGLFMVPTKSLTPTGETWAGWVTLRDRIRKDLIAREDAAWRHSNQKFVHRPFENLRERDIPVKPVPVKPPPPPPTTVEDPFERYMREEVDDDVRRRATEGRD